MSAGTQFVLLVRTLELSYGKNSVSEICSGLQIDKLRTDFDKPYIRLDGFHLHIMYLSKTSKAV